jgi:hypothetical protein
MEKLRIIVGGFIGLYPTGGVTWDYIQYPVGLHLLGHDVYYLEDTMQYSTYQSAGKPWNDATDSIDYLKRTMEAFGLKDRWAYRDIGSNRCYGMALKQLNEVCRTADVFINVSASTYLREEYLSIPKLVLVDSDPMFTQIQDWDDNNHAGSMYNIKKAYEAYDYLFTFGENINAPDCKIPTYDLKWLTTRQPVCLDYWKIISPNLNLNVFTTVMNWSSRKKIKYFNEEWGQKDVEFEKIKQIPRLFSKTRFSMAVADNSNNMDQKSLEALNWIIQDPLTTIRNAKDYQLFIQHSSGEFSVAKETYVKSNSGWFSCRSACYLASGKPVITQQTKWSDYIPSGKGLFAFTDTSSAIDALEQVTGDIELHSKAAAAIGREYFDSNKVLADLLKQIG